MNSFSFLNKYWNNTFPVKPTSFNILIGHKKLIVSISPIEYIFQIRENNDSILITLNSDIESNEINFIYSFCLYFIFNTNNYHNYYQTKIDKNNENDMEALNFALDVMLPTVYFKEISKRYISISKVAEKFGVSERIIKQKERQIKNSSL